MGLWSQATGHCGRSRLHRHLRFSGVDIALRRSSATSASVSAGDINLSGAERISRLRRPAAPTSTAGTLSRDRCCPTSAEPMIPYRHGQRTGDG